MSKELIGIKLPKAGILYIGFNGDQVHGYTAKEMQEYAYTAVLQERERCTTIFNTKISPTGYDLTNIHNSSCFITAEYSEGIIRSKGENK